MNNGVDFGAPSGTAAVETDAFREEFFLLPDWLRDSTPLDRVEYSQDIHREVGIPAGLVSPTPDRAPRDPIGTGASVETQFNALLEEWLAYRRPSRNLAEMLAHPAYQRIIGMGLVAPYPVVQLILRDLCQRERYWFDALYQIVNDDPVPADATTFEEFRIAWLEWGKAKGLIE